MLPPAGEGVAILTDGCLWVTGGRWVNTHRHTSIGRATHTATCVRAQRHVHGCLQTQYPRLQTGNSCPENWVSGSRDQPPKAVFIQLLRSSNPSAQTMHWHDHAMLFKLGVAVPAPIPPRVYFRLTARQCIHQYNVLSPRARNCRRAPQRAPTRASTGVCSMHTYGGHGGLQCEQTDRRWGIKQFIQLASLALWALIGHVHHI